LARVFLLETDVILVDLVKDIKGRLLLSLFALLAHLLAFLMKVSQSRAIHIGPFFAQEELLVDIILLVFGELGLAFLAFF